MMSFKIHTGSKEEKRYKQIERYLDRLTNESYKALYNPPDDRQVYIYIGQLIHGQK